mmetsp:Transcript_22978/g.58773  ORF Transcript_22978/g.58773 Transcript_22978/m.58773 type:complete len:367 (-) Transcript_22978:75-1175(-)
MLSNTSSAARQMALTVRTVSTGYLPRKVSDPSSTPSAPSSTRLATSVASARVGRGASVMVSTTRVTNTGLPMELALLSSIFCARNTFSGSSDMPSVPRLNTTASAASTISLCPTRPSMSSRRAMMRTEGGKPARVSMARHALTSAALCVCGSSRKSHAPPSAECSVAQLASSASSAGPSAGRGERMPCCSFTVSCAPSSTHALFTTQCTHVASTFCTVRYAEVVSAPVNRYWPTNTEVPGAMPHPSKLPGHVMGSTDAVAAADASLVRHSSCPASSLITAPGALLSTWMSGPGGLSITAHRVLVSFMACFRFLYDSEWYATSPKVKSKRASVIPAFSSSFRTSTDWDCGPIVQASLVATGLPDPFS